ncbi:MAG: DUF262 domain-containing protein [Gammaproteobacteria bacterium]|nr:MAG: DUF262 domain-containing protein [Gammaproteobacteria bacterium]
MADRPIPTHRLGVVRLRDILQTGLDPQTGTDRIHFAWIANTADTGGPPNDSPTLELPSFQRGFVWRPHQVELLWDSLCRGLPIGAVLLGPTTYPSRYHLIDGRQRITSLRLAKYDPFADTKDKHASAPGRTRHTSFNPERQALWVDLAPAPANSERQFLFRLTTRAHPWGYPVSASATRLSTYAMRQSYLAAMALARRNGDAAESAKNWRVRDDILALFLPWDATAPIPVAWIVETLLFRPDGQQPSVDGRPYSRLTAEAAAAHILKHHFYSSMAPMLKKVESAAPADPESRQALLRYRQKLDEVRKALDPAHDPEKHAWFVTVFEALAAAIDAPVPASALIQPDKLQGAAKDTSASAAANSSGDGKMESADPELILFERVNRGGTPLSGDELILAYLKRTLEPSQGTHQGEIKGPPLESLPRPLEGVESITPMPATPPQVVATVARIARYRQKPNDRTATIAPLRLSDLKRLLRDKAFKEDLSQHLRTKCHLGTKCLPQHLNQAWRLLTGSASNGAPAGDRRAYCLPPVLAADICTARSRDVLALLLLWLISNESQVQRILQSTDDKPWRETIGTLTALAWFPVADKPYQRLIDVIASKIHREGSSIAEAFKSAISQPMNRSVDSEDPPILAVARPEGVRAILERAIEALVNGEVGKDNALFYYADLRHFAEDMFDAKFLFPTSTRAKYVELLWNRFVRAAFNRWFGGWRLLCYGQRDFLRRAYEWYDPSDPEATREHTIPWDYDHILPSAWFYRVKTPGIPNYLKKEWGHSIGNLRIWPAELNRSKRDDKLFDIGDKGLVGSATSTWFKENLGVQGQEMDQEQLLDWSAIGQPPLAGHAVRRRDGAPSLWADQRQRWSRLQEMLVPGSGNGGSGAAKRLAIELLADAEQNRDLHREVMVAIIGRALALYETWYRELRIGELFGDL